MTNTFSFDAQQLQQKRAEMRQRCYEVALANTPACVGEIHIRRSLTGRAYISVENAAENKCRMDAPRPCTRKALYIFLHECAHFVLHLGNRKKRHVEEMEAEQWAHQKMREAGLAVPREMTQRAKAYVRYKIRQAERRGAKKIRSDVRRWATP